MDQKFAAAGYNCYRVPIKEHSSDVHYIILFMCSRSDIKYSTLGFEGIVMHL